MSGYLTPFIIILLPQNIDPVILAKLGKSKFKLDKTVCNTKQCQPR